MSTQLTLFGIPIAFLFFALTLVGVALFARRSLEIAAAGLAAIALVRLAGGGFDWLALVEDQWSKLVNLFGLLVGFALVADHFERSHLPERLPRLLPGGALGCFVLLALVWVLSGVLDNIAAALIGVVAASRMYSRLHAGYVAGIVAAANGGGAGSVIGDTTTTMMWLEGIRPATVLPAYLGAFVALLVLGIVAARQQARWSPLAPTAANPAPVDRVRVAIVSGSIAALACTNLIASAVFGPRAEALPALAIAVWLVLAVGGRLRPFAWPVAGRAARAALFLLVLVLSASLLPVDRLPRPTVWTTVLLGFVSAVLDNIPLTKLALVQGGYDWSLLAYSVGFGGSMIWFGSSAGVAVSEAVPDVRSVAVWVRHGWHIPLAFLAGHAAMLLARGWHPS
ncbi:MAG TPA: citrate transporter [Polyangia bacterium]|nr:citrate transporter [Polyangia bacterium]